MKRKNDLYRMLRFISCVLAGSVLAAVCAASSPASTAPATPSAGDSASGFAQTDTCYEVFVYSFYDSDGDGTGDLAGVLEKLDYINDGDDSTDSDLGCDMIWLMPVFASPTYHKYDVTDYMSVDPVYGTDQDLDALLAACHERGVRVILDLPVNHTSVEHPWFTEAADYVRSLQSGEEIDLSACPYADYYLFSREPASGYAPLPGTTDWYYEARFWEGMPDLNLDSSAVREELKKVTDYWTGRGVDGYRLDAVTSYYTEDRQKSIEFCAWLNSTVKEEFPDSYLVGEAWTDLDSYAQFYESGIDSMFDFAFAGQEGIIKRVASGKRSALWYAQRLVEEEELFASYEKEGHTVTNAPFYTNHDMARSAGYYTRDDGSHAKFAQGLNLIMPGRVFLYYGEELGMKGSGRDENKRAPMYWSDQADALGMCAGPPEMEEVKMKYDPEDVQEEDPHSILEYVRRAIRLRSSYPAIARGRTQIVEGSSVEDLCLFWRKAEGEQDVLLAINTADEALETDLGILGKDVTAVGGLYVGDEEAYVNENILTVPPMGIAVLTAD